MDIKLGGREMATIVYSNEEDDMCSLVIDGEEYVEDEERAIIPKEHISSSSLEYTTVAISLPPNFISIFPYQNILSPYILKLQTILIEQKIFHAHDHKAFLISPRLFCSIYYNNLLK